MEHIYMMKHTWQYATSMTTLAQEGMINYAFMSYKNVVDKCTFNVQSHYVKIALCFFCKRMLDTFCLAGSSDQKMTKNCANNNLKIGKAASTNFRVNLYCSLQLLIKKKSFSPFLVLQEYVLVLVAPMTALPHFSLLTVKTIRLINGEYTCTYFVI